MKTTQPVNASLAKISALLMPEQAVRFDAYCEQQGQKQSTLIARLIRQHLDREQFLVQTELSAAKPRQRKRG